MRTLRRFFLYPLLVGLCVGAMLAQQPKTLKPAETPAAAPAPQIPDGLAKRFFKAHAESSDANLAVINAQKVVEQKVQAERQVIAELQAACGEKFQPNMNQAGDVVCQAKPEVPKPEAKK